MTAEISAKRIDINGIVQGVGFRPFVYQLARRHHLAGHVANTALGVTVHVEGAPADIDGFLHDLPREKPPLALMVEITEQPLAVVGHDGFRIAASRSAHSRATLISPDVSICEDCRRELFDPNDRRFGYPFINCTNCGPRYTIIEDIPYDRPKTSMRHFTLCADCQAEYDDPDNRRFHAQPNACPVCGPRVSLFDSRRVPVDAADPIAKAAELIKDGAIVAVKGLGGFHLAADAMNDDAVLRLRQRKVREEKPLAVMTPDLEKAATFARLGAAEAELLSGIQRPIVLLPKRLPEKLAYSVSPRNHYYGVMLPYTPLHYLLMARGFTALVMTSGNLSDEPIAIDNQDAFQRLGAIADYFLVHDRDIYLRSDDSIVRFTAGSPRFLRRSRGYVPVPVFLRHDLPPLLACGGELKNTICLTRGRQAFLSQHIGDMENLPTEAFFEQTIDHLKRILDIAPQAAACDLHPDYLSTQWAVQRSGLTLVHVQHHHAHVVSCMAENKISGPVIGLSFDGTGLGPDGTVWGGEVLIADAAGYRRAACFEPVPMPGGAVAIKEPWRLALAYLYQVYGQDLWHVDLPLLRSLERARGDVITAMLKTRLNAPLTSSLGRIFDGVAAIMGLRQTVAYEGQAAMELEMIADGQDHEPYACGWTSGDCKLIQTGRLIQAVCEDLSAGVPAFVVSRKFHSTVVAVCADLCAALRDETRLDRVVLSGGCFQNTLLLEGLTAALRSKGFQVYAHLQVPCNDGGLALGQAVVAAAIINGQNSEVTQA